MSNEEIRKIISLIKSPTNKDTITLNNVQFNAKKLKQFVNLLKHHSYNFELNDTNLHLYYQNKNSNGIAKFHGSRL